MTRKSTLVGWVLMLGLMAPGLASAQDEVAAPSAADQFTAAAADAHSEDDVTLRVNAGANLAYGNARSLGFTVGANFALREAEHSLVIEGAYAYGIASTRINPTPEDPVMNPPDYDFGDWNANTNNLTGRIRYDYFMTPDDSIWAEGRLRRDPFAYLLPQVSIQAGYQRNIFREENHRLWFELGLDLSYQRFGRSLPTGVTPAMQLTDRTIFAYKGLLGYSNELDSGFTYNTRFEVLGSLIQTVPPGDIESIPGHLRMQWVNQFRSTIEDWLQLSVDITGRLDSLPAGQVDPFDEQDGQPAQMFDLTATLNLVGNFDLDGEEEEEEAEEEPEAEPEPSCPVCEVCAAPEPCAEEASADELPPEPTLDGPATDEPAADEAASDAAAADAASSEETEADAAE